MDMHDRARLFGEKFANDQEMAFRLESRACRLFGLWAAEEMGLEKGDAQTYARDVVASNMDEPGLDDVLRKVRKDLIEKNKSISDHILHRRLEECMTQAHAQIMEEGT